MIWHVFSAIRGIFVGIFMTEYRKRRYQKRRDDYKGRR